MAKLKYGVYHRAKVGYEISGDAYLIKEYTNGMLVCLVDGLGSGPMAAEAAQVAVDSVASLYQAPLPQILTSCHNAMRGTRGAVMALVRIDTEARELAFLGVGNVEFHAWSAEPMRPISFGGIVGSRLPSLREFHFVYTPGDLIILHTDGISRRFVLDNFVEHLRPASPQCLAKAIADNYAKRTDDVTLVVVSSTSYSDIGASYSQDRG
jgi:negative regulator of sigma-B (phosphoserine phosphatase)